MTAVRMLFLCLQASLFTMPLGVLGAKAPAVLVVDRMTGPLKHPESNPAPELRLNFNMRKQIWGDHDGNLYFSVEREHRIFKIEATTSQVKVVAGTGKPGFAGDRGIAYRAQLYGPGALWGNRAGEIFFIDGNDHASVQNNQRNVRLRKVDKSGIITTIVRLDWDEPMINGIWGDAVGMLYVTEGRRHQVLRIGGNPLITSFAGKGGPGSSGDNGDALSATFFAPNGIWGDGYGSVYVAEMGGGKIRKIKDGVITTVAGQGGFGFSGDGGKATSAQLACPCDVWGDHYGNLYIPDMDNNRIRKVDAHGMISTIAGNGVRGFSGDGGPATAAKLFGPKGVWVDRHGQVYISDTLNHRIRRVDEHGVITTFGHVGGRASHPHENWSDELRLAYTPLAGFLISDPRHHMVLKLRDNTPVKFAGTGHKEIESTQANAAHTSLEMPLNHPEGFCATKELLYLLDSGTSTIQEIEVISGRTRPLLSDSRASANTLSGPTSCVVWGGQLYVTDRGNHRIAAVTPSNGAVSIIAGTGDFGCESGKLGCPYGITIGGIKEPSLYITDPCCPNQFVRKIGLADGVVTTVSTHKYDGTAEDKATVIVGRHRSDLLWIPGIDDCNLELLDQPTGLLHPVEILHADGQPFSIECIVDAVEREHGEDRFNVDLLAINKAGDVELVHAQFPTIIITEPHTSSKWNRALPAAMTVRWEVTNLWGMIELALVTANGTSRHSFGAFKVELQSTMDLKSMISHISDGWYFIEARSKRYPLVHSQVGPIELSSGINTSLTSARSSQVGKSNEANLKSAVYGVHEHVASATKTSVNEGGTNPVKEAKVVSAVTWPWIIVGMLSVALLFLTPFCCLRITWKGYGNLGGTIQYKLRGIFAPPAAATRSADEMDPISEVSEAQPMPLGRTENS
eukprot:gnl/MRDRNA2_/MRDRNA2_56925_c0_seq1.p1 gnl/MRDRNA2_/MRDRNA2_56925_c0~~gnl/MRDRNA2_/MRDRNA2_56925_c0_seq1.p1  ORF type:complete len:909 (-),score=127.45 gnl/MRDRNA2_/MRDRNA2_56925_c0_seq1:54-2780(-)